MERSQGFIVQSQVIGIALLLPTCLGLIVYGIRQCRMKKEANQDTDSCEMT
uniref:Uncharacterized protein n=1 Tax=Anguilla anguilla TaxID=7936 RepID=A0A0E9S5T7_ANGAN